MAIWDEWAPIRDQVMAEAIEAQRAKQRVNKAAKVAAGFIIDEKGIRRWPWQGSVATFKP